MIDDVGFNNTSAPMLQMPVQEALTEVDLSEKTSQEYDVAV